MDGTGKFGYDTKNYVGNDGATKRGGGVWF
jgi:hypothetical protein